MTSSPRFSSRPLAGPLVAAGLVVVAFLLLALAPETILTAGPTIQVCMALDGSGSIQPEDFTTMKQGLAAALEDSTVVPQNGAVELTVIQFGGTIYDTPIIVEPVIIDNAAAASTVASVVRAAEQRGGFTPTHLAIDKCREKITGSTNFTGALKQVIDISTDGNPDNQALAVTARDNAVAAGIDEVDLEGIGTNVNKNNLLQLAYPQPGYEAPPFGGGGFVIMVSDFSAYASAIRQKLQEVIPRPTPTTTSTATATATPATPTATATATPSPTPPATATPVPPTPTPVVENGGFEGDGGWTLSGAQRTNGKWYSGGWSVVSTPGANGRLYAIISIPEDTIGATLYFYWDNANADMKSGTCNDYMQVKIMNSALSQVYGTSDGYCSSSDIWYISRLGFTNIIGDIRGKTIALIFEIQQDSQPPHAVFYLDDVVFYLYNRVNYVPIGMKYYFPAW